MDSAATPAARAAPLPAVWCQGLWGGTFVQEAQQAFAPVNWQPQDLIRVLGYALPAAAAAVTINSWLPTWLASQAAGDTTSSSGSGTALSDAVAMAASSGSAPHSSIQALALLHIGQEAVLAVLLVSACRLALGPRVAAAQPSRYWVVQTAATCVVLFPLVDPLLYQAWQQMAEAALGPAPANPLVGTLQAAGAAQDWAALGQHCMASGLLGPLWEEVFWRGFFLTALTKVLPLPGCIALSALNFAALHLSPESFAPLLLLGAACDCLYLRSGGNLLAPLLLHSLWNTSQVLQIALLHKETFV